MQVLVYDVDFSSSGSKYPIKNALELIGYQADMFDWRTYLYSYQNNTLLNRIKDRLLFEVIAKKINTHIRKTIQNKKYDFFLVVRGEHIFSATIEFAKKYVNVVVNWNSDDLFNRLNSSHHVLEAFDKYDYHFSARKHLKEEYIQKGAKRFETINWFYRPEMAVALNNDEPFYKSDIAFIGSWSQRRNSIMDALKGNSCDIYGWGWQRKLDIKGYPLWNINGPIGMMDMSKIFLVTKVNINLFTVENRDISNPRLFDIPAAGGFQLSERSEQVLDFFTEDKNIVCFSNPEELRSKVNFYLKNDTAREKIKKAANRLVLNEKFRLQDRVKEIMGILEKYEC